MAEDLARVFGDRLVAVVAYAPERAAAFTRTLDGNDLEALSVLAEAWHKSGLETPLLLTADEFARSLDAFPIEYQAIIDRHVVIAGAPPFDGVRVRTDELRRACEAQAKGHLIHLRQSWVDAAGHSDVLMQRVAGSALPLRVLLSHVATLVGDPTSDLVGEPTADLSAFAAARCGANADLIRAVLTLETQPDGARAILPRMNEYLHSCEQIWAFVDGWRA